MSEAKTVTSPAIDGCESEILYVAVMAKINGAQLTLTRRKRAVQRLRDELREQQWLLDDEKARVAEILTQTLEDLDSPPL